jgi:hypothetical protein
VRAERDAAVGETRAEADRAMADAQAATAALEGARGEVEWLRSRVEALEEGAGELRSELEAARVELATTAMGGAASENLNGAGEAEPEPEAVAAEAEIEPEAVAQDEAGEPEGAITEDTDPAAEEYGEPASEEYEEPAAEQPAQDFEPSIFDVPEAPSEPAMEYESYEPPAEDFAPQAEGAEQQDDQTVDEAAPIEAAGEPEYGRIPGWLVRGRTRELMESLDEGEQVLNVRVARFKRSTHVIAVTDRGLRLAQVFGDHENEAIPYSAIHGTTISPPRFGRSALSVDTALGDVRIRGPVAGLALVQRQVNDLIWNESFAVG